MKYNVTSLNTKKTLAIALKKQVIEKPFSKVTVSAIINDCGVNRKTFYYHFEDVNALLKWTLEQEAIEVVKQFDFMVEYEEAILFIMDYVEKNQVFLLNIYHSIGRDEIKRFFYADFISIIRTVIDNIDDMLSLSTDRDFKAFLCEFYTEAIAGLLVEWIVECPNRSKEKTLQYLSFIMNSTISNALQAANQS